MTALGSFTLAERDAYARVDYQYQSGQTDRVPSTNPANGSYDPIFRVPKTDFLRCCHRKLPSLLPAECEYTPEIPTMV